ncbi:MAG TPA: hypothetical protein VGX96_07960 [Candidatus Elarobacter sp.]|nr:hypothetical protein [Candidatus Elarobacter sp.]
MYSDAVKIVVFSDDPPERMLRRMRAVLDQHAPRPDWSVRFREVAGGEWTSLWPTDYNPERRCAGAAESPDEWSEPPDWKYQLVVQYSLADTDMRGFDDLIALELQIEAALADRTVAELDGNDVGSGEFNLFIFCDAPPTAFERIRPLLESASPPAGYRAAYRSLDDDDSAFHALWPPTLTEFSIA